MFQAVPAGDGEGDEPDLRRADGLPTEPAHTDAGGGAAAPQRHPPLARQQGLKGILHSHGSSASKASSTRMAAVPQRHPPLAWQQGLEGTLHLHGSRASKASSTRMAAGPQRHPPLAQQQRLKDILRSHRAAAVPNGHSVSQVN